MRKLPHASSQLASISRRKLYLAILTATQFTAVGQVWAGPEGGQVVGGAGTINQSGTETVITQQTDRMAIDWQSFDVKVDERVQFIQPNSSSVALNRVLSNKGSEILGRVDANGHVFLVNPNGVVFGKDSHINVGGILASGMSIDPTEFMNGNFTLNSLDGTEGKVINSGIINAATGGSVTLLGKEVKNEGLIAAKLGAVNLAAGKEAVVTFDSSGLVGVKVTKAILQNELGLDAAVLNSGEINAQGGRILISASTSQDIFSQAVNHGELSAATSAVVNEDGSFTLGAGADVVNTGSLNVSSTNGDAGQIVALGNKVTNSGLVSANTETGHAGHIEFNSTDTTQLTQNSNVTAQATTSGTGGDIKILGDKVGLFDSASVNTSGANGGGQVLIGGDKTGKNKRVNNANFIYLGENTNTKTDAFLNGNGGKLITFAQDTARIYGNLSARGGSESGNGGFIETSGLKGFEILKTPDIGAVNGLGGSWLIDPYDLTIVGGNNSSASGSGTQADPYASAVGGSTLGVLTLLGAFVTNNAKVYVETGGGTAGGNIFINADLSYASSNTGTLQFDAGNNINVTRNISSNGKLNLILNANLGSHTDSGNGDIVFSKGVTVDTSGGSFTASGKNFTLTASDNTTASISTDGGAVSLEMTGAVKIDKNNTIATNGGNFTVGKFDSNGAVTTRVTSFSSNATGANLNTFVDADNKTGGSIKIYTTGDADLGSMSFGGESKSISANVGSVTVDSNAGNISLTGNYFYFSGLANSKGTMKLTASKTGDDNLGKITLSKVLIDNYWNSTSKLDLDFQAINDVSINYGADGGSGVWLKGGIANIKSTLGDILVSNSNSGAALGSEGGEVKLDTQGAVIIKGGGVSTGGGNFTVLNSKSFDNNFTASVTENSVVKSVFSVIDTSGKTGGGDILINSAGNVTLGSLVFTDSDTFTPAPSQLTNNTQFGTVKVVSGGDVSVNKAIDFNSISTITNTVYTSFLDISAAKNININENISTTAGKANITLASTSSTNTDKIALAAGKTIATNGGYFYVGVHESTDSDGFLDADIATPKAVNFTIAPLSTPVAPATQSGLSDGDPKISFAAVDTNGGNFVVNAKGAVDIGSTVKTGGGNFTVLKSSSFTNNYDYFSTTNTTQKSIDEAVINTSSTNGGGAIFIASDGAVTLGGLSFSDSDALAQSKVGSVTIKSKGTVTLAKDLDFNNTGFSGANKSSLDIAATGDITISGGIFGGSIKDAVHDAFDVTLVSSAKIDVDKNVYTSGGNFSATATQFDSSGFTIDTENSQASVNGGRSNGGDITLNASTSVTLGNLVTDANSTAGVTRTGNLNISGINKNTTSGISTDNVTVTQGTTSNTISVAGTTTFNLGGGDLILGAGTPSFIFNPNAFVGAISFTSVKDVKFKNTGATTLGQSTITGGFDLVSGGNITQVTNPATALVVTGATNFELTNAANNNITLSNTGNDFQDKVNFSGANFGAINFNDTNSIALGIFPSGVNPVSVTVTAGEDISVIDSTNSTPAPGAIATKGGAITLTSGNNSSLGGNISVGALTTTFSGAGAGQIKLTAKAGSGNNTKLGTITAGALTADGASVEAGKAGANITLLADSSISVGDISTVGNAQSGAGGAGGTVSITSNKGSISAQSIVTSGGDAKGSSAASGGAAGTITLKANNGAGNITLTEGLAAQGGSKANAGANGSGNTITLTGKTVVAGDVVITTEGKTGFTGTETRGDIVFSGTVNSDSSTRNLTLTGKTITFGGAIGATGAHLGSLIINSSSDIGAANNKQNFYTSSFNVTAPNFYAALIDTSGVSGGIVKVQNAATINVNAIDSQGTSADGGAITLGGNNITLGTGANTNVALKSSGAGKAGDIKVTASGASPTITLKGDVQAVGGTGTLPAEFILGGSDNSEGGIDFSGYAQSFTSDIKVTGRGGSVIDKFTAQNLANTWDFSTTKIQRTAPSASTSTILFSGFEKLFGGSLDDSFDFSSVTNDTVNANSIDGGSGSNTLKGRNVATDWTLSPTEKKLVTSGASGKTYVTSFNNIQTLQGGSAVDTFTLSTAFTGDVKGGADNDVFNISASVKNLYGEVGDDNFTLLTNGLVTGEIDGGDASEKNKITGRDEATTWTINATTKKLATISDSKIYVASFSNIQTLQGGSAVDKFTLSTAFAGDVRGGADNDIFDISATVNNLYGEVGADTFNVINTGLNFNIYGGLSSINSIAHEDIIKGPAQASTWTLTDVNSGELTNADPTKKVSFFEIEKIAGGSASDTLKSQSTGTNTWYLETKNSGTLTNTLNAVAGVLSFSGMTNLKGNIQTDTFAFKDALAFFDNTQDIDAVAGAENIVDYSKITDPVYATIVLNGSGLFNNVKNASTVKGNNANSSLSVTSDTEVTWGIDTPNDGTVSNTSQTIKFIDFTTINGAAGNNIFSIADASSFNGAINGGSSTNTLKNANANSMWTLASANGGTLSTKQSQTTFTTTFTNIQTIEGSNSDSLTGSSQQNTWTINKQNSGVIVSGSNTLNFSKIANLAGGTDVDKFNFITAEANNVVTRGEITGVLDGGGNDADSLILNNENHIWSLIGTNAGSVTDEDTSKKYFTSFKNIEKLIGGKGNDVFKFSKDGTIVSIDGGDGSDTYSFKDIDATIAKKVILDSTASNGVTGIENFIGNGNSTIEANNVNGTNTWSIYMFDTSVDGVDDGKVKLSDNSIVSFENFKNIIGGGGKDVFDFFTYAGGSLTGKISGGGGNDDEIIAPNVETTWTISDSASVANKFDYAANSTQFESVEVLTGSNAYADTYIFSGASTGTFKLVAGDSDGIIDVLDLSKISTAIDLSVGDAGVGGLTVSGIESFKLNKNTDNKLTGYAEGSNWVIDRENGGTVTSSTSPSTFMTFDGFKNLTGANNKSDIFTFISVTDASNAVTSGKITGTIDGGTSTDSTNANKIVGLSANNDWSFTANNEGKISTDGTDYLIKFKSIQTLEGNDKNDKFTLAAGKGFTGTIKGGAGSDSLVVTDGTNEFAINSINSGVLNNNLTFENIEKLTGGTGVDTFKFNITTAYGGAIDAGTGAVGVVDVVDFSGLTSAVTVNLGETTIQGVANAEKVVGNSVAGTTLKAVNTAGDNAWIISDTNTGTFQNANNNSVQFTNFATLVGAAVDQRNETFTLQGTGTVTSIDGGAGAGTNSLSKANGINTWVIGADVNSGTLNASLQFKNIQSLAGGSGLDTLSGHNKNNTWNITKENEGSLAETAAPSAVVSFTGMENLTGNAALDIFTFSTAQSNVTGLIDGGSSAGMSEGIIDTLNVTALAAVSIELGAVANPTANSKLNVNNVEEITASSTAVANNQLTGGSDRAYSWVIDGTNRGTVFATPVSTATPIALEAKTSFINFGKVTGGSSDDRFTVTKDGKIANIDGGSGEGKDFVDYSSKKGDVNVDLNASGGLDSTGIKGIEGIVGNNNGSDSLNPYKSTITISEGTNTWTLGAFDSVTDGVNDGQISINNSSTNIISFENFNILNGGSGVDTFEFSAKGKFVGTINGGQVSEGNIFNAASSKVEQLISINGSTTGATNLVGFSSVSGSSTAASELVSLAAKNDWLLDAANTNVNNVLFKNFSSLKGSAGVDIFTIKHIDGLKVKLNGAGTSGTTDVVELTLLDDGKDVTIGVGESATTAIAITNIENINAKTTNNNTLVADSSLATNSWSIDALNNGLLNSSLTFAGFANLVGGAGVDTFIFAPNGMVGSIDGGASSNSNNIVIDEVNLTKLTAPITVELGNGDTTYLNLLGVEKVSANESDTVKNTLRGSSNSDSYVWTFDGAKSGNVVPKSPASKDDVTSAFSGFSKVLGGSKKDSFIVKDEWVGYINGGDGVDVIDYSLRKNDVNTVIGDSEDSNVVNVEGFVGNGDKSKISVSDVDSTWTIGVIELSEADARNDGKNDGTITFGNPSQTAYFINFSTIAGGAGNDIFNVDSGATLEGSISGGKGNDTLNVKFGDAPVGTITFKDTEGTNAINLTGGNEKYVAKHESATTTGGVLKYETNNATQTINYLGAFDINDSVEADRLELTGIQNIADVFSLSKGAYAIGTLNTISYSKKNNLTINGESADKIEINGDVVIPNTLTIQNAIVTQGAGGKISANTLRLDGTATVGTVAVDGRVKTNIANLYVSSTLGETYLNESDSLNLTSFNTSKKFDLLLAGDLTQSALISSTGAFSVNTSGSGKIILNSKSDNLSTNRLTGELSLTSSGGDVVLSNSGVTTINTVSSQNLTINSNDAINAKGDISVKSLASFDTIGNVTAKSINNDFHSLLIKNAADVDLVNKGALSVNGINASGNIKTQSEGVAVTGTIKGANVTLGAGSGNATIGAEVIGNDIVVDVKDNSIGGININSNLTASSINLDGQSGLVKLDGILNTSGKQTVTVSAGEIIQTADINSGGNVSLTASGDVSQKANIKSDADIKVTARGTFNLDAGKNSSANKIDYVIDGIANFLGNIAAKVGIDIEGKSDVTQSALLSSLDGDIKISAENLKMNADAGTTAEKGAIKVNTVKDISITKLNAIAGTVSLTTQADGKVVDANGDATNIIAKRFEVDSGSGVGDSFDAIETSVSELSLANKGSSKTDVINIQNSMAVTIDRLRSNGNIILTNLAGNVLLDNTSADPYNADAPAKDALLVGGPANANYDIGALTINVIGGDLGALGSANYQKPDITARQATINVNNGSIGSKARPMVMYVKELLTVSTLKFYQPIWGFGDKPDKVSAPQAISTRLSSDAGQLVQVETLDEVNPAVFTGVRNYVYDDIAILLPLDQRYGDKDTEQ